MEIYITICKIDSQREFGNLLYVWLRKLKQGLCINLEGWGGEREGLPSHFSRVRLCATP